MSDVTGGYVSFEKAEIEQTIVERFEQQVAKYGDRMAVRSSTCMLSYDDMNKATNRIARTILAQCRDGTKSIALLLEHGAGAIIGIYGVLKAGKIYIPLDPSHPRTRNACMLADSQANLILTDNRHFALARDLSNEVRITNIDEIDPGVSSENLNLPISPDDIAYIIYTSGTTGQPKGVFNNHRNLLHHIMRFTNGIRICADDCLTLLRSYSFNGTLKEIFGSLLNGASLHLFNVKEEGFTKLADWLIKEGITISCFVATTFRQFASTLTGEQEFSVLRVIYLGAETVYKADFEAYKKYFSEKCILFQGFGTAETGTVSRYMMNKGTQIQGSVVPVGYTVPDMKILLLDEAGKDVVINSIGEIAAKSKYLALGYWRRPDLTRAVFLPDPDGGDERTYLTGDLGSMTPDKCLIHLGRKDSQVKVRGHRVEVVEVETALLTLEIVKEAAVVAREDCRGDHRLVAYIVPTEQRAPTVTQLRKALSESLPDYMIPSTFMMLDAMPLTPHGKTDKRALPEPGTKRPELETTYAAPRTPVEQRLTGIWSAVLGLDEVGIYDNFFDLGGHSLLATQIVSRVVDAFQVDVTLRSLLQLPNVADMAVIISQSQIEKMKREDIDQILAELEIISDEEAKRLIYDKGEK